MSSRTKRTTTTTVSQQASSSSQPGTPSSSQSMSRSPGRVRPSSPTVITRKEEKKELAGLNDRLAAYIDRVRFLEGENKHLRTQIQTNEETVTKEVTNIKQIYESELADARKLLDETAKDKAKLQIDAGKFKTEADEWKDRAKRSEAEVVQLDKRLRSAEAQVNDLQAKLGDAVNDRKHWETEYNKLRKQVDSLTKQLETAKSQLEAETLSRVDLENRLQSLKEELSFKDSVHEQQLNETRTRTQVTIDEVDSELQREYEGKLKDALHEIREDYEYQIRSTREETEEVFEKQLGDIRDLLNRKDADSEKIKTEIRNYRKRIDELSTDASRLAALNATLESRVKELENALRREQEDHRTAVDQRDAEIRRLRDALEDQLSEYRDLLDIKIALDVEIAAYRKLLEGEEARLNISTASEATPRRGGTPRRTPMLASRKRKRGEAAGYSQRVGQSEFHYVSNGHSTGPVEIYKTDEEGKFIKLFNNSDKDLAIGGWTLKHEAAGQETVYKFHRSVQLKAKQYVTVWSAESGQAHSPPSDLVMKGQKWFIADQMKSTLVNSDSEDTATMEMEKTLRSQSHSGFTDSGVEGDPQDKCSIM